jgi:hypothetical protein
MGASSRALPELVVFYGMLASFLPTTASVESDFSRPKRTKSHDRRNTSCLSLEGAIQANDLLLADLVDVPFTLLYLQAREDIKSRIWQTRL